MEQTLTPSVISGIFAICLYLFAVLTSLISLKSSSNRHLGLNLMTIAAVVTHGFYLYLTIDAQEQQNLNLFNMMGLTNWLAMIILLLNAFKREVTLLIVVIGSFAAMSVLLGLTYSKENTMQLGGQWASLVHIFAAIIATGFLLLAAIQAILVIIADRQLRSHPTHLPSFFPPLQSLESFLFQLLVMGFALMSLALVIALFYLDTAISHQPIHKSVLSTLAWVVFAVLLIGHRWRGWRGRQAAHWTLGGFTLLCIGYFGSKLVIELILN